MFSLAKVLLPVDFSERSRGAAHYARTLAAHFHPELTLLHALAPFHYGGIPMDGGAAEFVTTPQVEAQLERFQADEFPDLPAKRVVLRGDPAPAIVDYAHQEKSDLVVMPTHGYGPFRRFLLGSVTAKVLHDADCPVLTGVHLEQAQEIDSIRSGRLLCAVDLGPTSEKTLAWADGMAAELGAHLTIVHAIPDLERHAGDYFDPSWRQALGSQARERIEQLQSRVGVKGEVFIESGDASKVLRCAALHFHAGLLVIGRGSAGGVFGRLRANAYAIIRESPCPVISV